MIVRLLLLLFTFVGTAASAQDSLQTLENSFGFTLRYPSGWSEETDSTTRLRPQHSQALVSIEAGKLNGRTLFQVAEDVITHQTEVLAGEHLEFAVSQNARIRIAGAPALRYTAKIHGTPDIMMIWLVTYNNWAYAVQFRGSPDEYDAYRSDITQMLASLRFV